MVSSNFIILKQRSPPTSPKSDRLPHPQQAIAPPISPKSKLTNQCLRYRPPTSQKAIAIKSSLQV
jgi:hypothetical protein